MINEKTDLGQIEEDVVGFYDDLMTTMLTMKKRRSLRNGILDDILYQ